MKFKSYQEVLDYLYGHLPMYQRVGPAAYKADLNITVTLDRYFGFPHQGFQSIHIAGTNGKGSVAHMLASVCQAAGLKTGLYTSPHLKDFTERIKINGQPIDKNYLLLFFNEHYQIFEDVKPSFFEMSVMLAFSYFNEQKVDIAIIETGMGGRLDSTNIISPLFSVITNIGMDHTRFLGNTLSEIAMEKAGIIKDKIPVVVGDVTPETREVFNAVAEKKEAKLYIASEKYSIPYGFMDTAGNQMLNVYMENTVVKEKVKLDLSGMYQRKNLVTVIQAVEVLKDLGVRITDSQLRAGLSRVRSRTGLRGRWEILGHHPLVVADTAHNQMGLAAVLEQIIQTPWKNLFFVLGFVEDKEIASIVTLFPGDANYLFTQASVPRAMNAVSVQEIFSKHGIYGTVINHPSVALHAVRKMAGPDDMIFIGGSTFLVADIL